MNAIFNKGTFFLISMALLFTIVSMLKEGFPRFNDNEWWIFFWAYTPYIFILVIAKYISITKQIIPFIGSLLFSAITIFLLIDSLYVNIGPKSFLVFLVNPILQTGIIMVFLFINVIYNVATHNNAFKRDAGKAPRPLT